MSTAAASGVLNQTEPFPSDATISAHLPPCLTIIRTISILALTALAAITLSASPWVWPVIVIVGVAWAAKVLYTNFFTPDPLIEAFYKIVGGKERFNKLPTISLEGPTIKNVLSQIKSPGDKGLYMCKALQNGRHIIFVQEKSVSSREKTTGFITKKDGARTPLKETVVTKTSNTYALVQTTLFQDLFKDCLDTRIEQVFRIGHAIIFGWFDPDYFHTDLSTVGQEIHKDGRYIHSSFKGALANQWYEQKDFIPLLA